MTLVFLALLLIAIVAVTCHVLYHIGFERGHAAGCQFIIERDEAIRANEVRQNRKS